MIRMKNSRGFTIVELLIIIVVIGILAGITIVAYSGVQNRAKTSAVQSAASLASKKIEAHAVQNSDIYPANLTIAGITNTDAGVYLYSVNNDISPRHYCVTAVDGEFASYKSSANSAIESGICPGHWDKSKGITAAPIDSGVALDTTTFRTSTASMRLPPGANGDVRGQPFSGEAGEKLTVGVWVKTDSGWNGTSNNSKVRFGNASNDALVAACAYNGPKVNWTFITCTFTFTVGVPSVRVRVANDGTTGNVWFDDLSLSLPN